MNTAAKNARDGFGDVVPLDFLQGSGHHAADDHQHAGGCADGTAETTGARNGGQGEADRHNHGGQAGAAACGDAGGRARRRWWCSRCRR